jgi:hypothetical protein
MAKRAFATQGAIGGLNPLGSAAATGTFMALTIPSTVSASALCDVLEVLISGTAAASAIGGFFLVRASTLATGAGSALVNPNSDGGMLPSISALATPFVASIAFATTQPTLSNAITDAKLNLGLNTFGGILRWNAAPTQQWQLSGIVAPGAQSVLSNITGGGAQATTVNAHILYEPY